MTGRIECDEAAALGVEPGAIAAFISREWQRGIALALPGFYRWQFAAAPDANASDHSIVLLDDDGVCGFLGVTPRAFMLRERERRGAEMTTWLVASRLRGRGLASRMLSLAQSRYDVLAGASIADEALPFFSAAGFRRLAAIPRYVRVYSPHRVTAIAPSLNRALRLMRNTVPPTAPAIHTAPVTAAPSLGAELNGFVRKPEWLAWRYDTHPVFEYESFVIETESGPAFVVVRHDQLAELSVVHVLEVLAQPSALPEVVAAMDALCADRSVDLADLYMASDRIAHVFRHRGWLSVTDDPWIDVPHLFHPIEYRSPPTASLMLWARGDQEALLEYSRLYLTKGDIDLDRPTLAYMDLLGQGHSSSHNVAPR